MAECTLAVESIDVQGFLFSDNSNKIHRRAIRNQMRANGLEQGFIGLQHHCWGLCGLHDELKAFFFAFLSLLAFRVVQLSRSRSLAQ